MFFKALSYIKFLLNSTNQHGVHSPFVFNLVTKGLYKKGLENNILGTSSQLKTLSNKEKKILSKIINYFNVDKINFDLKSNSPKKYNLLYIKSVREFYTFNLTHLISNYFIIIHGIHQNKNTYQKWLKITEIKEVTVTIDLFYFGLIFFRKEQAKEHFKIRV